MAQPDIAVAVSDTCIRPYEVSDDQNGGRPVADDGGPVVRLRIDQIQPGDSPRLKDVDEAHAQLLADTEEALPPITVHRSTLRLIDGRHRVRAAIVRGDTSIRARLFDGTEDEAFIHSVQANNAHGLPLTASDRRAAVVRLLQARPEWSDRAIAYTVGVSAQTVSKVRRSTVSSTQLNGRVGLDGRVRPLSTAEGRRKAAEIMAVKPDASLREVAREVGLSPGTVNDVRRQIRERKDLTVPAKTLPADGVQSHVVNRISTPAAPSAPDSVLFWHQLRKDPSLNLTQFGRNLLTLLRAHHLDGEVAESVPAHCVEKVAVLAKQCSIAWGVIAERLEHRSEFTAQE
ncbi:ParB/RepB/Spo0J family partition protein [Streptomyces sp. AC550_RSS872]|uniref:ParB/RepB/Spo0J family partition protein n=1 Tax=Streptomyces sp. AC550_RSS872 TaxID=2823689 RepID=UPI001C2568B2|nr:ParB N-terminal domain-containing protein [Streptomyces sp. AC550_RSS872]